MDEGRSHSTPAPASQQSCLDDLCLSPVGQYDGDSGKLEESPALARSKRQLEEDASSTADSPIPKKRQLRPRKAKPACQPAVTPNTGSSRLTSSHGGISKENISLAENPSSAKSMAKRRASKGKAKTKKVSATRDPLKDYANEWNQHFDEVKKFELEFV